LTGFIVSPHFERGNAPSFTRQRRLEFGPNHVEWVPEDAIEVLQFDKGVVDLVTIPALQGMSEHAIAVLSGRQSRTFGPGYIDITESGLVGSVSGVAPVPSYPTPDPSAHPEVDDLIAKVSAEELKFIVGNMTTNEPTRYFRSTAARKASTWVQAYMQDIVGKKHVELFENSFDQPNVIGRIPGDGSSKEIIVLGGHLDSTSSFPWMKAPGADDDASGVAIILSVLRILTESGWRGKYAIEAHAYAGEEGGLLGSQKLAAAYKKDNKVLRGFLNLEMVGWQPDTPTNVGKSSTITVLSDPSPEMAAHMSKVVKAYSPTSEARFTECGYGCSDHYSWSKLGYPVVCLASYAPRDKSLNPNYHSFGDTWDKLNYERMSDFVKVTLAWIVEVSSS
jgi:Zn-dependent M28 family amino/carboxypeptidase